MSETANKRYGCGIHTFWADRQSAAGFWRALEHACAQCDIAFAVIFFSGRAFDAGEIVHGMQTACPGVRYAACSTSGEITPQGMVYDNMVAVLFPAGPFRVSPTRIREITSRGMEAIVADVAEAKRAFLAPVEADAGPGPGHAARFALCLVDGMSFSEESVTAALHWGLDDIPLLGGSAGDDMAFSSTTLILDGEAGRDCALLLLVETTVPFHIFKTDNFIPTGHKLVVTRSDPDRRIVHEFNAAPAAQEYARAIGKCAHTLSPLSFASHPLVVRVGGEYFCRSIQKMNEDGSLSFFCAIDDGIVLTVAEPAGMAKTTGTAFETVRQTIGEIDLILGFDCVLRQIDAENRQAKRHLSQLYTNNNVIGFNTYGEQYLSMHLNQTLTGIAFARPQHGS